MIYTDHTFEFIHFIISYSIPLHSVPLHPIPFHSIRSFSHSAEMLQVCSVVWEWRSLLISCQLGVARSVLILDQYQLFLLRCKSRRRPGVARIYLWHLGIIWYNMVPSVTISYNLVHAATIWTAVYIILLQFVVSAGNSCCAICAFWFCVVRAGKFGNVLIHLVRLGTFWYGSLLSALALSRTL